MKIVETSLRDGHQSLLATRLTTKDILKIIPILDEVGFYSLEIWGGATFDSSIRFLNENPWQRLKLIKQITKKTKLQMLLRGQNLVGYKHYSDDVVDLFIKKTIDCGIDIIRIFDALNDFRNIEKSVEATLKYGAHCQIAISFTTSEIHTNEYYIELAKNAEKMGANSICIKDMAGLLLPKRASELIKSLKKVISIPINLHSHSTTGIISATYLKAVESKIDILDTALSPLSGGTSQMATESFHYMLKDLKINSPLDEKKLNEAKELLQKITNKYLDKEIFNPKVMFPNPQILGYQVPGGMLSNLLSQLRDQNIEDKFDDVLKEIPNVRKDFGYPPLVTPISQLVGVQATLNVISKKRYSLVSNEVKDYFLGKYGRPPGKLNIDIQKKLIKNGKIIKNRPADLILSPIKYIKNKYSKIISNDEDLLMILLFEDISVKYLKNRNDRSKTYLTFSYNEFNKNKKIFIKSFLSGYVDTVNCFKGQEISKNSTLFIVKYDKIVMDVLSPIDGIIEDIFVDNDSVVEADQKLAILKKK